MLQHGIKLMKTQKEMSIRTRNQELMIKMQTKKILLVVKPILKEMLLVENKKLGQRAQNFQVDPDQDKHNRNNQSQQ